VDSNTVNLGLVLMILSTIKTKFGILPWDTPLPKQIGRVRVQFKAS
jgi:hypothetical protein